MPNLNPEPNAGIVSEMAKAETKQTRLSLSEYYEKRFKSDPYSLLHHFAGEIANAAQIVGIDFAAMSHRITLVENGNSKVKNNPATFEKKDAGRTVVFADLNRTKDGWAYPFLTFSTKANGGHAETWSGMTALIDLWRREQGHLPSEADLRQERKKQEQRRRDRETWLKKAADRDAADKQRKETLHDAYKEAFKKAPAEPGDHPYLVKKGVGHIASQIPGLRRMHDRDALELANIPKRQKQKMIENGGEFVAMALHNVEGKYLGLQRLYEKTKRFTVAFEDKQFNGALYVLGDLKNSEDAYVVEGAATGFSVYLATGTPVIITFSADNLVKVLKDIYEYWTDIPDLTILADIDMWKPEVGNAGFRAALKAAENHPDIKILYPPYDIEKFYHDVKAARPTDFNDFHALYGLEALADLLTIRGRAGSLKLEPNAFKRRLQQIRYLGHGKKALQKACLAAVSSGMNFTPWKFTSQQLIDEILAAVPKGATVDEAALKDRLRFLATQKLEDVRKHRGFSKDVINDPLVNYVQLQAEIGDYGEPLVPARLVELILGTKGIVIVRSPMGSGKTERLMKPIMAKSRSAAYIAHRISLIADACNRLDIHHYNNMANGIAGNLQRIGCCVNSITSKKFWVNAMAGESWFDKLNTLCIDEISQVIRHITGGAIQGAVHVTDKLIYSIKNADRILMCDADANDDVIALAKAARPNETITVYDISANQQPLQFVHTTTDAAMFKACEAVNNGKKVLLATDGKKSAESVAATMQRKGANVLMIHKDTKGEPGVAEFLQDPNTEITKYDAVVYTPAISSGVSIVTEYFDMHVGIFHGVIPPQDAYQMLRRDRTGQRYLLGLDKLPKSKPTDPARIFAGMLQADKITLDHLKFDLKDGKISIRHQKSYYDQLKIMATAHQNEATNNFSNNLLLMLAGDGHKIAPMGEPTGDMEKIAREWKKQAAKQNLTHRLFLLHEADDLDEAAYVKLRRQEFHTLREAAAMDRYIMKTQLGTPDPAEADVEFFDNRGLGRVVAYELLHATEQQAADFDRGQINSSTTLTRHNHKLLRWKKLHRVFEIIGVDIQSGSIDRRFTHVECRAVMDELLADDDAVLLYNHLRIGRHVSAHDMPKDPTMFVRSIMQRLGLDLTKTKSNGRNILTICPDHFATMEIYRQRREEAEVSSLKFTAPDIAYIAQRPPEPETADPVADWIGPNDNRKKSFNSNTLYDGDTLGEHRDNNYSDPALSATGPGPSNLMNGVAAAAQRLGLAVEDCLRHLSPADRADIEAGKYTIDALSVHLHRRISGDPTVMQAVKNVAHMLKVTVDQVLDQLTPADQARIREGALLDAAIGNLVMERI